MRIKEQLENKLLDTSMILWSVREIVEHSPDLTREKISHLRTLLEIVEENLKEVDQLFEELAFQNTNGLEVCNA